MATLLIIEDDHAISGLLVTALTHAGHSVESSDNGPDGLMRALQLRPDVIISDVMLPRLDGWTILRTLRARRETADIPVIFLTQLDSKEDRIRGLELGAEDYLTKPFHPEELVLRVHNLLTRRLQSASSADGSAATDMEGRLEHFGLASLLALLENERASGVLRLLYDARTCEISMLDGKAVRATLSPSDGADDPDDIDAVAMALSWEAGSFRFVADEILADDRIGMGTTALLMEATRRLDERAREA